MAGTSRGAVLIVVIGAALLAAILVVVVISGPGTGPVAVSPTPTPTPTKPAPTTAAATSAAPAAAPASVPPPSLPQACDNISYQAGDAPVLPPRRSGQFMQMALDRVVVLDTQKRTDWAVRFFVPRNAPGTAEIPLQATITDGAGRPVTVMPDYQYGPPNAGTSPATGPLKVSPCGTVILVIRSAPITSGRYTLTLGEAKLPEGGTKAETFDVNLTCDARPGPAGGVCK